MKVLEESPHLAEVVRSRIEKHYKADEIIKGVYWESGKGCAVGCMTESEDPFNSSLWKDIGINLYIPRLCDVIFEGLPNSQAKSWPSRFWTAIESAKGKDLGLVHWKFLYWLLNNELKSYHSHVIVGKSIVNVMDGIELKASGKNWEANAEANAAASAAETASYQARAAACAAAYGDYAARAGKALSASRMVDCASKRQANKLINLIEGA